MELKLSQKDVLCLFHNNVIEPEYLKQVQNLFNCRFPVIYAMFLTCKLQDFGEMHTFWKTGEPLIHLKSGYLATYKCNVYLYLM